MKKYNTKEKKNVRRALRKAMPKADEVCKGINEMLEKITEIAGQLLKEKN